MKNRQNITALLLVIILLITDCVNAKSRKRPNILFCIADDVSYPHMGAYGTDWVITPAFDRVAAEGVLFDRVYTCNAKSAPSRSAIITGRNSWQLEEACNHSPYFPSKFKSYPEVLEENGYFVGFTGKGWGPGIAKDSLGHDRKLVGKAWNQKKLTPPTSGISNIDYSANFREFLDARHADEPFCFWYGALEPHRGYEYGSSIRAGKNVNDIDSVPSFWPDNEVVRTDMLDYALELEHFDKHLEIILQILEQKGELDNTIIVVTADHGMPFPRCKGQSFEYSNHIPFAVMWKNGIKNPGRTARKLISVIDIAPTFLEIAGVAQESSGMQPITGVSFMDVLQDVPSGIVRDMLLLGKERHDVGRPDDEGYPIRAIIKGDYLYIKNFETDRWPAGNPETGYLNVDGGATKTEILNMRRRGENDYFWNLSFGKRGREEFYDILNDRDCVNNLINDLEYASKIDSMRHELTVRLIQQQDPRILGNGAVFDKYPYAGAVRMLWNRMQAGEKIEREWINETDDDPPME